MISLKFFSEPRANPNLVNDKVMVNYIAVHYCTAVSLQIGFQGQMESFFEHHIVNATNSSIPKRMVITEIVLKLSLPWPGMLAIY